MEASTRRRAKAAMTSGEKAAKRESHVLLNLLGYLHDFLRRH